MTAKLRAWLRRVFIGCDHDWVWLHDTPSKQASLEREQDEWFEDYPFTDYPKTYRCRKCGITR